MDKLIDAFCQWPAFGQGFFLFLVLIILCGFVTQLAKTFVSLFRGWPNSEGNDDKETPKKTWNK
jgi:hypothetical protein